MTAAVRTRNRRAVLAAALAVLATAIAPQLAPATHEDEAAPNDPLYAEQWGPPQVRVEQAWDRSTGTNAVIAIVDSGVDLDHPDLVANTIPGATFVDCQPDPAVSCGNGDWDPDGDDIGEPHGTHVAGIAAGDAGNGEGIVGIAPDARVMAVRGLDDEGSGSFEDIAFGIRYAVDNGAHVVNLSLGVVPGVGQAIELTGIDDRVEEAVQYAHAHGVTVVAAAGNETFPVCDEPGFSEGAVCVTATTRDELPADYSNQAVKPDTLAVAAPGGGTTDYLLFCGGGVLSTVPPGQGNASFAETCGYPEELTYDEYIGTSMATPHVAGVAGLLVAQGCTREQILEIFTTTSRQGNTEERGVFTTPYGWGIVDADAATAAAVELCDPRLAPAPPSPPPTPPPSDDTAPAPGPSAPPPEQGGSAEVHCSNAVLGSGKADRLVGSDASELLSGLRGDDRLEAGAGSDCVRGGGGDDRLAGGPGDDELKGDRGADRVEGDDGDDVIRAARGGRDRIDCGPGDDTAFADPATDEWRRCETVTRRA